MPEALSEGRQRNEWCTDLDMGARCHNPDHRHRPDDLRTRPASGIASRGVSWRSRVSRAARLDRMRARRRAESRMTVAARALPAAVIARLPLPSTYSPDRSHLFELGSGRPCVGVTTVKRFRLLKHHRRRRSGAGTCRVRETQPVSDLVINEIVPVSVKGSRPGGRRFMPPQIVDKDKIPHPATVGSAAVGRRRGYRRWGRQDHAEVTVGGRPRKRHVSG
jgi:hypothetical protein